MVAPCKWTCTKVPVSLTVILILLQLGSKCHGSIENSLSRICIDYHNDWRKYNTIFLSVARSTPGRWKVNSDCTGLSDFRDLVWETPNKNWQFLCRTFLRRGAETAAITRYPCLTLQNNTDETKLIDRCPEFPICSATLVDPQIKSCFAYEITVPNIKTNVLVFRVIGRAKTCIIFKGN